jgi:hypothetical protein
VELVRRTPKDLVCSSSHTPEPLDAIVGDASDISTQAPSKQDDPSLGPVKNWHPLRRSPGAVPLSFRTGILSNHSVRRASGDDRERDTSKQKPVGTVSGLAVIRGKDLT